MEVLNTKEFIRNMFNEEKVWIYTGRRKDGKSLFCTFPMS